MLRTLIRTSLTATLLATTMIACTQSPAQVDLRGQSNFGRSSGGGLFAGNISSTSEPKGYVTGASSASSSSYQPASVYTNTEHASVPSVGVSELAPPPNAKVASKPAWSSADASTTIKPAAPVKVSSVTPQEASPAAGSSKPAAEGKVNPWTGKTRPVELWGTKEESFNLQPQSKQAVAVKEPLVSEIKTSQEKVEAKPIVQMDTVSVDKKKADAGLSVKQANAGGSDFIWPIADKRVLSSYGPKGKGKVNDGINIASAEGEPVWAAADGEVVYVGNELQGYGNMVLIKHSGGKTTTYAHLNRAGVDKYARVKQGDIIGYVGKTGNAKSPQLHFAVRDGKEPVDPLKYVNRDVASLH
jgi:murein DD-endopeptidase MepM/ murein hydrolase activator NlpD